MDIPSMLYDILLLSLGGFVLHGPDGSLFSVFSANDCLFVYTCHVLINVVENTRTFAAVGLGRFSIL